MLKLKFIIISLFIFFVNSLNAGGKCQTPPPSDVIPIASSVEYYVSLGATTAGVRRICQCATQRILKDVTYGGLVMLGVKFNKYISIEARITDVRIEKDFSTTKYYGLSLKPTYDFSPKITGYATLGYGQTIVEGAGLNNYDTLETKGVTFGLGVDYHLSKHWSVWADWQNLLYDVSIFDTNTNLVSTGITYHF